MNIHKALLDLRKIVVVGCGGNGSIFASHLCRIDVALRSIGGTGLEIVLVDPDVVTPANLGRQCFCEADIGQPKAVVLAQRLTAFYGCRVLPIVSEFTTLHALNDKVGDAGIDDIDVQADQPIVLVGCVDTIAARKHLARAVMSKPWTPDCHLAGYWLDLGNMAATGQVVLGGNGLPTVFDLFPELSRQRDNKNLPSCSVAESLERQDLFINSTLANLAGQLLWRLIRAGELQHHGYFVNLGDGIVTPIEVPQKSATTLRKTAAA